MSAPLNIRDIGEERKAELLAEADRRGMSLAEVVRTLIDEGLERSRAERERAAWIESAREGLAYEAERLEREGPTLARYRRL
jgi:post-segregation antitoxin (ccd killing protein)